MNIPIVQTYKYLGIVLSNSLKLQVRLETLKKKRNLFKLLIWKLKPEVVPLKVRITLWVVFMKSVITYGIEAVLVHPAILDDIRRVYQTSLKIALNLPMSTPMADITKYLDIWPLEY